MPETKGEMLISGIDKIREGLEMISNLGDKQELIKTLIGSQTAANRLKDLMKSNLVFKNTIMSMIATKNSRLSRETVEKVITDFMDVLFDLSQPYKTFEEETTEVD